MLADKMLFVLYCYNVFATIFSYAVFVFFIHTEFGRKMGGHIRFVDYAIPFTFILCCIVVVASIIIFIFGNVDQKIGTIAPFVLAVFYVGLLVVVYYTIA